MVDFDKRSLIRAEIMEKTGGPAAGGLTVRDVIAIGAMGVYLETIGGKPDYIAQISYEMADAMLDERVRCFAPKQEPSVEEAFGLDK